MPFFTTPVCVHTETLSVSGPLFLLKGPKRMEAKSGELIQDKECVVCDMLSLFICPTLTHFIRSQFYWVSVYIHVDNATLYQSLQEHCVVWNDLHAPFRSCFQFILFLQVTHDKYDLSIISQNHSWFIFHHKKDEWYCLQRMKPCLEISTSVVVYCNASACLLLSLFTILILLQPDRRLCFDRITILRHSLNLK